MQVVPAGFIAAELGRLMGNTVWFFSNSVARLMRSDAPRERGAPHQADLVGREILSGMN